MKRLTVGFLAAVVSVVLAGSAFCQGGVEELPLAEQKAFEARQQQGDQKTPTTNPQQAPQSDQPASAVGQQLPQAAQGAPQAEQPAPQAAQRPPQAAPNDPNKATVYIYRVSSNLGAAYQFNPLIFAKDGPLGVLPGGSYYSYLVDAGTAKLWNVFVRVSELKVEVAAGQTYYVEAGLEMVFAQPAPGTFLRLVPPETGAAAIAGCQPLTQ